MQRAMLDYRSCQSEQAKLDLVNMLQNSFEHIVFIELSMAVDTPYLPHTQALNT